MNGRLAGLGVLDQADHPGQGRIGAGGPGLDGQQAIDVEGSGDHRIAPAAGNGHAFAGDERFVHLRHATGDDAVGSDLHAGAADEAVTHPDIPQESFMNRAVFCLDESGSGPERQQFPDGLRRTAPRLHLQLLADEDQGDDDGRGLEIEMPGRGVTQCRVLVPAEEVGGCGSRHHQHLHVRASTTQGIEGATIEPGADHELQRCGEKGLDERMHGPAGCQHLVRRHLHDKWCGKQDGCADGQVLPQIAPVVGRLCIAGGKDVSGPAGALFKDLVAHCQGVALHLDQRAITVDCRAHDTGRSLDRFPDHSGSGLVCCSRDAIGPSFLPRIEAGPAYHLDHRIKGGCAIEFDGGPFRGQVDGGGGDSRCRRQHPFQTGRTGAAGHAVDEQLVAVGFGSGNRWRGHGDAPALMARSRHGDGGALVFRNQ